MIDSHAHIFSEYYNDIDLLVNYLKDNKIIKVINCSTCYKNALEVVIDKNASLE